MEAFTNDDIDMFVKGYENNVAANNVVLNEKIPIWVEYLKTKKHYRMNGMDEDFFFKKRFNITNDELVTINKLMNRLKSGKMLGKNSNSDIMGNNSSKNASSLYSNFNENEVIDEKDATKFELFSQVESAMADYHTKMKKQKDKKLAWKNGNKNYRYERELEIAGSVNGVPDNYYTKELSQERPQIEYDVQSFAKSPLFNMSKTNIIHKIDKVSSILDQNNLISTEFDTQYKKAVPVIHTKNKQTYACDFDNENINQLLNEDEMYNMNIMKNNNKNMSNFKEQRSTDVAAQRFWQDQDILNPGATTRKPSIKNKQPFENQFQYLDTNYNRVLDPRLFGQSSRLDNREYTR